MQLGVYSFAEATPDVSTGQTVTPQQRMHDLLEEIVLADEVGLDVFGIGEHHRPDYIASAPAVVLAAAASRTKTIRLTSAVTVLSSDDPVRVFQDFATVDLISNGRAEIMAGRGSFIESYPLFGYDLDNYDELFSEKLQMLLKIRDDVMLTWSGKHTQSVENRGVYPRPMQTPLPVWIAVGGTPQSVVRAGTLGLPLAIAIIGGAPERFVPFARLYRESAARAGHDPSTLELSINSHGLIGDTASAAAEAAWPPYLDTMGRIGRERGWPPPTRRQFDAEASPRGAMVLGSPQQVIDKILYEHELFGMTRFLVQFTVGSLPHATVMRSIELFGTEVAPVVRKEVSSRLAAA
ncbi:MAG: LLM class flavin-dependent oxidoreductase [Gemmatimonadaceae bacterium]